VDLGPVQLAAVQTRTQLAGFASACKLNTVAVITSATATLSSCCADVSSPGTC
jgi:hypothetical protein